MGSEVKSLRETGANIAESYAAVEDGELWLVNSYIAPYDPGRTFGHEDRRRRKLLVSRKELSDLWHRTATNVDRLSGNNAKPVSGAKPPLLLKDGRPRPGPGKKKKKKSKQGN